jgi:hypothetical protein
MQSGRDVYQRGGLSRHVRGTRWGVRFCYILAEMDYGVPLRQLAGRDSWQGELPLADKHATRHCRDGKRTA